MRVIYDKKLHETHVVTLYYEDYPSHVVEGLDTSSAADREGNKPLLCLYTFNREFESGLISLVTNAAQRRTLY